MSDEKLPFVRHSVTSEAAAKAMRPSAVNLRQQVFDYLKENGPATDKQIQGALQLSGSTERPRRIELVEEGRVAAMGQVTQANGRQAMHWGVVSDEIIEALVAPPHLSPSSMSTFHQCPQKFKYEKIDYLPRGTSKEALLGNFVHDFLEVFYGLEIPMRTKEAVKPMFQELFYGPAGVRDAPLGTTVDEGGWIEKLDPYVVGTKALREFKNKAWWCVENLWKVENPKQVVSKGLEYELNGELDGINLKGFIDRLDGEDGTCIVDYKTGNNPFRFDRNTQEWVPKYKDDPFLQLKIYAALVWALGIGTPDTLKLLYLKDGQEIHSNFTELDVEETKSYVVTTKWAIDTAVKTGTFPTRVSNLCNWCSYKPQCPAFVKSNS
jgi:putative RecB family exonuclease